MKPGDLLLAALQARGMPQAWLARRTGLSTKHINWLVKGRSPFTAQVAVLIEDALPGVTAEELMVAQVRADIDRARTQVDPWGPVVE